MILLRHFLQLLVNRLRVLIGYGAVVILLRKVDCQIGKPSREQPFLPVFKSVEAEVARCQIGKKPEKDIYDLNSCVCDSLHAKSKKAGDEHPDEHQQGNDHLFPVLPLGSADVRHVGLR